ncbi:hypothetical protein Pelo_9779 [Pelomyxa schiedti]|nr:hypothetical protein Pelo_9779 [Pelomyxa schiedti]
MGGALESYSGRQQPEPEQPPHSPPQLISRSNATTAKSQAMAVCCAGVVRWSGSHCPPSMVAWARSPPLVRMLADRWVLRAERDALFDMSKLKEECRGGGSTNKGEKDLTTHLYVSVSHTLGVVTAHCFSCSGFGEVVGCLGLGRILCGRFKSTAAETKEHFFAVDLLSSRGPPPKLFSQGFPVNVKCNWKWIVAFDRKGPDLLLTKVVDGAIAKMGIRFIGGIDPVSTIQFAPWCDDVLMMLAGGTGTKPGSVALIDLKESFNERGLVFKFKAPCREHWPLGVMWMPDGSMATLRANPFTLASSTTGEQYQFPPFSSDVEPISRSHALVWCFSHLKKFHVYHTGNLLSAPSLSVPCTWAGTSKQTSGLIASTPAHSDSPEIQIAVHDGTTGFHLGGQLACRC